MLPMFSIDVCAMFCLLWDGRHKPFGIDKRAI
jgi:hypothetical protein